MTLIPLGTDDIESKDETAARIRLENMYLIDSPYSPDGISRVSRPTLTTKLSLGSDPVYGMFREDGVFEGVWFIVSGTSLYSYDPISNITSTVGSIPGTGWCEFAGGSLSTGSRLLVLRDGIVYSWNGAALSVVNMPDGQAVGSIAYLDSYYFLSVTNDPTQIGRFYWISPGDTDPDPLDFATAERLPDELVSISVLGDELWLLGGQSTEVWQASGNADAPFQRISGRAYNYGCVSNNTTVPSTSEGFPCLIWVTDGRVVVMAQGSPKRISNDSVDELLRTSTNYRAWGFQYNRHSFYILTCDEVTLVYDLSKQTWAQWGSYLRTNFRAHFGLQDGQDVYAGDSETGTVWKLVEGVSDDDDPVIRTVSGLVIFQGNFLACSRVNVIMNSGWTQEYGDEAVLELCWSDDLGGTYSPYVQIPVGKKGEYKTDVTFSGLGMIRRPGRLFKFRFSDKSRFRLDYATMNEM